MAAERASEPRATVPVRVGAAFGLLMQIRMLVAAITLLLLPTADLTLTGFMVVLSMAALSWLAARYWERIVPWLLAYPILLAADVGVCFAILGIGGTGGPFFLSTVITAGAAGLLYRWRGAVIASTLQIACYYVTLGLTYDQGASGAATFQTVLGQPVYYPLAGFAGAALRRLFDDQAAQEAARRRAEVIAAAADERTRLAREMHDSLAKTLRGIALAAAALPTWVRTDQSRAIVEADRIAGAMEIASREARGLLAGLRGDTITRPLAEAVEAAVRGWETDTGVPVRCEIDAGIDLPVRARYEAMGILSEALANIERHAEARAVCVRLAVEDSGGVLLSIEDDGRGFAAADLGSLVQAGHYGLAGLHERVDRIRGTLQVASEPGRGTTVTARIPATAVDDTPLAEVS